MEDQQVKILVVDDDPTNLSVLLAYLNDIGYKVLIAPNGEQALVQLNHVLPDVILLDIMMPGIDGFETCRRIKAQERTRHIPVIFMTALSDSASKIQGFRVGGVDYITKPFQHEEVLVRVNTHVMLQRLQHNLVQQNRALQDANASKDKFFSIIAHDLRSPLGALRDLPDVLLDNVEQYSREALVEFLIKQRDAANNLFKLLENLLTWARIQQGRIDHHPQTFQVEHLVNQNIELLRLNVQQKHLVVHNAVPISLRVHVDYHILNTILRNLLSNAVKFTHPGGTITVSAAPTDDMAAISVSDSGIGMTADQIAKACRIDAKFKRRGTANEQGTGLGLILCQEFVKQYGGCLSIESAVNQGTTVTITLPLAPDAVEPDAAAESAPAKVSGKNC